MQLNYKIVITGGSGRFGSILKKNYKSNKLFYPNKSKLNILSNQSLYSSIYIPEGFAHGFLCLDNENIVYYGCSNYRQKDYEIGILWNDKDLKINWPIKKPILSDKDFKNISFKEYCKNFIS